MAGDVKIDLAGIGTVVSGIGDAAKGIREAITGKSILDPAKQAEVEMKILDIEQRSKEADNTLLLAQAKINEVEASSGSIFKSGWRPFIGWICSFGCAYGWIVYPIACWIARVIFKYDLEFPAIDTQSLMSMTIGLLGLGGMRSFEKAKGVASK